MPVARCVQDDRARFREETVDMYFMSDETTEIKAIVEWFSHWIFSNGSIFDLSVSLFSSFTKSSLAVVSDETTSSGFCVPSGSINKFLQTI